VWDLTSLVTVIRVPPLSAHLAFERRFGRSTRWSAPASTSVFPPSLSRHEGIRWPGTCRATSGIAAGLQVPTENIRSVRMPLCANSNGSSLSRPTPERLMGRRSAFGGTPHIHRLFAATAIRDGPTVPPEVQIAESEFGERYRSRRRAERDHPKVQALPSGKRHHGRRKADASYLRN
jgi:hypothetical protein